MEVVIYSKDNCVFCDKAVKLAFIKETKCTVKKLGVDFEMEDMMELFPTARTFPQIILNGENIGGYTEFEALVK
jgi:glutaredoxin 3|tara:strand:- start:2922 stop:3143 length:222 start_codon:yes stop_codon:yes gene_type:complete